MLAFRGMIGQAAPPRLARVGCDRRFREVLFTASHLEERAMLTGIEFLTQTPIFDGIPAEIAGKLCERGSVVTFSAGQTLFARGQEAENLMILQDGIVELLFPVMILGATREVAMESKRPGDLVAWSALVHPYQFTLSARCASDSTLACFTRDTLLAFFESDVATGYRFMSNLTGVIGRRLQALHTIWMHDLQSSVAKRLE
jgi:CRP-like cAMP-binding protein